MASHSEKDWDGFWRNTSESAAYRGGAPQEAVLKQFWSRFFIQTLPRDAPVKLLDIACGNGVVSAVALQTMENENLPGGLVFGLDLSLSALKSLRARSGNVHCVLATAARPPFKTESIDVLVSQFGLEYAGLGAIDSTSRLLKAGGVFAAIFHLKNGAIYDECESNRQAIIRLKESHFLPCAKALFSPPLSASDRQKSQERFVQALTVVDAVLKQHGAGVAGGTVQRLRADVLRMVQNPNAFSQDEVVNWITGMGAELDAYSGRMSAMMAAALDENEMEEIQAILNTNGLRPVLCETMKMGVRQEKAAWALIAESVNDGE